MPRHFRGLAALGGGDVTQREPLFELAGGNTKRRAATTKPHGRQASLVNPAIDAGFGDAQPLRGLANSEELRRLCHGHTQTVAAVGGVVISPEKSARQAGRRLR